MAIDVDPELRPLRDAARSFLDERASSAEVHRLAADPRVLDRAYWSAAAELGWTSLLVPEEAGGGTITGRPFADLAVLAVESGRHVAPGPLTTGNVVAWTLSKPGVGDHESTLAAVLDGSAVVPWALAEGRRWSPTAVQARVERTADGYTLTGVKRFVESAADADLFLVTGRDDTGLVHLLVDRGAAGVRVRPQHGLDPTRGFGSVEFDSTPVPHASRLGGDADALAESAFHAALAVQAAESVGLMQRAFDLTLDWVGQRVAFGRPIGSYQAIKHRMADHLLRLETAAGAAAGLAAALDADSADTAMLASATKAHIGDAVVTLVQDAIQLHGGIGVTWEHDLHLYLRRASTNRILYGDPAEHRDRLCRLVGI